MGNRKLKPVTPGQRFVVVSDYSELTTDKPEKSLLTSLKKKAGRNNSGRITCRHKGGGSRKAYRVIDFHRNKLNVPGTVKTIEYDPNRNVRISLVQYADGDKRYILTPQGIQIGATNQSGPESEIKAGNAIELSPMCFATSGIAALIRIVEPIANTRLITENQAPY